MIDRDEESTVRRWLTFVDGDEEDTQQGNKGRVLKRLGDGLM
ncbi:MAG: hypothetical protein AAGF28_13270 [Pseudomonadota bacterium]